MVRSHRPGGSARRSKRLDSREQFARLKGFGHVLVVAHPRADDAVGFFAARRNHQMAND